MSGKVSLWIMVLCLVMSCVERNKQQQQSKQHIVVDSTEFQNEARINHTDEGGMKQGRWLDTLENGDVEVKTYRNDTLHGYYSTGSPVWRHEGWYKHGRRDSIWRTFSGSDVRHIFGYKDGKDLWSVAFQEGVLVMIKPLSLRIDTNSLYVVIPYPSGQTWYEGRFINTKEFRSKKFQLPVTFLTGIHKIYFNNGQLKGVVDYSGNMITEYNAKGKKMYHTSLRDVETHKQIIDAIYLEGPGH